MSRRDLRITVDASAIRGGASGMQIELRIECQPTDVESPSVSQARRIIPVFPMKPTSLGVEFVYTHDLNGMVESYLHQWLGSLGTRIFMESAETAVRAALKRAGEMMREQDNERPGCCGS